MPKLSDMQLIVLSRAAQRDDAVAEAPKELKGAAASKVIAALLRRKLLREVKSKRGMPVWRRAEDGTAYSLLITSAGRKTIGVEEEATETPMASTETAAAGTIDPAQDRRTVARRRAPAEGHASGRGEARGTAAGDLDAADRGEAPGPVRPGTKKASIIAMLSEPEGASIERLMAMTGWLAHTTRAELTRLRQRGWTVERIRAPGETTTYRITGAVPRGDGASRNAPSAGA